MDEKDFIKKGRKTPFVKWSEADMRRTGVVLWTKVSPWIEYGTENPKVDDDGNELMQMLMCIEDIEHGKLIIPVREGRNLHQALTDAVEKAEAEKPEPGGFVDIKVTEMVTSGAVTYPRFAVKYELPPSANGDDSPPF
jgi:hypothetical protein